LHDSQEIYIALDCDEYPLVYLISERYIFWSNISAEVLKDDFL